MEPIRKHPHKSFEEQLEQIEKKNIIIDDRELAEEAIRSFSYYSIINGYKDLFIDKGKTTSSQDRCIKGTTFTMLYTTHWLDISLSTILFKYTLAVEKKIKTVVSNLVSDKYTIEEHIYLSEKNYSITRKKKGKYTELINKIDESKRNDISAKHYFEKEGNVPPWIAAKGISFGSILIWFNILNLYDKKKIIEDNYPILKKLKTDDMYDFFDITLDQVYQYRNLTAHGNRTFSLQLPKRSKLTQLKRIDLDSFYLKNGTQYHTSDLCTLIFSLMFLINDKYVLSNLIVELEIFFSQYEKEKVKFAGKSIYELFDLPEDLIERLKKYYIQKMSI